MRILMLSQFYWPVIGGAERHVQDLCAELVARGHKVAVATLWQPGLAEFEMDGSVRVYRIRSTVQRATWLFSTPASRQYAPPFPDAEAMLALCRVIARERPEIVHAHNWLVRSFLPLKAWSGARLVVTLHDYSLRCATSTLTHRGTVCEGPAPAKCLMCAMKHYGTAKGVPTLLSNWVMGAAERRAVDMFLPVSQAVAAGSGLIGRGLPYEVIPNFLPDRGEPSRDWKLYAAQLPAEEYLLFVGALGRAKGVDVLLGTYGALQDPPPLVLIGYRTPGFEISTAVPGRVETLYDWPHQAVMQALRGCSLAIIPSVTPETFSLVAAEAMANGRPVIASRIGALPDLVTDGETGLLVPPGDAPALRRAIESLLSDPNLRERMGRAARRRVAELCASAVVPRIEHVYRHVLAASPRRTRQGRRTVGSRSVEMSRGREGLI